MSAILDVLSRFNPTGFAQQNQLQAGAIQQQAQQTKALQLENTIRQRQLNDQDALTQAWKEADQTADPDTLQRQVIGGMIKHNATGTAIIQQQRDFAQMRAQTATASKDELANAATIHEGDAGAIDSIVKGPAADQLQAWRDYLPTLQSHHPNVQFPAEFPGNDAATAIGNRSRLLSSISKTNLESAQAGEAAAKGGEAAAQAAAKTQETAEEAAQIGRERVARQDPTEANLLAAMKPKDQAEYLNRKAQLAQESLRLNETMRHNLSDEANRKITNSIAAGRLAQTQLVNGIKYGPQNIEYWVKTLEDNPDAVKEVPAELKSTVNQAWQTKTGLPLPTPLEGQAKQGETAARNALDNLDFIRSAIQNPEIQARLGPVLGRLGKTEQALGTAVAGLSPQAAELAQELRTRMRYFIFQEGRAVMGGRFSPGAMKELEGSSADVHMDVPTLTGALNGAEGTAQATLDNADRARFGGKMRPAALRSGPGARPTAQASTPTAGAKVYTDADVQAAMNENRGLSRAQVEAAFKAKGWAKQ